MQPAPDPLSLSERRRRVELIRTDAPQLVQPKPDQLEQILRQSHGLWGGGLSVADYRGLWDDLRATRWGASHARMLVHQDDRGHVLSSLKLYDPRIRLGRLVGRAAVIGALFTPVAERGRGRASALVRDVLTRARDAGAIIALLYSDIGTGLYRRLGFRALPASEQWAVLSRAAKSRGAWSTWSIVPQHDGLRDHVRRAHQASTSRRDLAVLRDDDHWEFLRQRSHRFFERLGRPELRLVSDCSFDGDRFVGYVLSVIGGGEWNVREVGSIDGDSETMAGLLRRVAVEAARQGARSFYGWLPPEVQPLLSDWRLRGRSRHRALPMFLALRPGVDTGRLLHDPGAAYLPFQDQF